MSDLQALAHSATTVSTTKEANSASSTPNPHTGKEAHTILSHASNDVDSNDEGDGEGEGEGEEDENGEKKYHCTHCTHSFTRKHNLKSHLLIHTQEKPFNCSICSSKFRRLHDLKRHEKLHTGQKPHQCKTCGRKFARADALVRHNNSQAGCALLIDDVLPQQRESSSALASSEPSTMGPTPIPRTILPQKRSYETSLWRLQQHTDESMPTNTASSAVRNSSTITGTPLSASRPLETHHTILSPSGTSPVGAQNELPENFNLLPYVRLLEARVGTLENKLTAAEAKISQLTYAVTGHRESGL
ncbi:CYFA0S04e02696g1_1 [Cyberlindnera fabianii]|uniref:CYFA0S04e02696g1_1 n=1 Tax=Cyberlindnera fabianii TaxID=36022 RepID=A0A061AZA1_CYBFA|nr:Transcriptional regulator prz1 [Cyberlindnera fabianii]CDR40057.1 CYFA0S04e02696g1_1 [Cyberlindnera fabianii]